MRRPSMWKKPKDANGLPFRLNILPPDVAPQDDFGAVLTPEVCLGPGGPLDASGPGTLTRWLGIPWQTDEASCLAGYGYHGISLRVLPAESSRLDVIAGDGWLALGDAAAAYDPLSSYGIASAMGSGFYGGHAIADILEGREDARFAYLEVMQRACGTCLDLQREHYARERRWPDAPFWRRRQVPEYGLSVLQ